MEICQQQPKVSRSANRWQEICIVVAPSVFFLSYPDGTAKHKPKAQEEQQPRGIGRSATAGKHGARSLG